MTGVYIAMWSGPRNLSTAMMRSFENRPDTVVIDEPFYGHYLDKTKIDHPGKEEILISQDCNWNNIVTMLTGKIPDNKSIWYQKHMAQHNLKGCDINWIKKLRNCLLIRDPKYVISSYSKEYPITNERLLGYAQQGDLIKFLENETGKTPPIIDASDILKNPKFAIKKLCESLGISFTDKMLNWPKGKRDSDGVWAKYWYKNVEESTGFKPYVAKEIILEEDLMPLYDKCMIHYSDMYKKRLIF